MTRFAKALLVMALAVPFVPACADTDPLRVERDNLEFPMPGDRDGSDRLDLDGQEEA